MAPSLIPRKVTDELSKSPAPSPFPRGLLTGTGSIGSLADRHVKMETKSKDTDHRLRARQMWRYTEHLRAAEPIHHVFDILRDECDPDHAMLEALGWKDDGEAGEEKWLPAWDSKGGFQGWIRNNWKRWRKQWDVEVAEEKLAQEKLTQEKLAQEKLAQEKASTLTSNTVNTGAGAEATGAQAQAPVETAAVQVPAIPPVHDVTHATTHDVQHPRDATLATTHEGQHLTTPTRSTAPTTANTTQSFQVPMNTAGPTTTDGLQDDTRQLSQEIEGMFLSRRREPTAPTRSSPAVGPGASGASGGLFDFSFLAPSSQTAPTQSSQAVPPGGLFDFPILGPSSQTAQAQTAQTAQDAPGLQTARERQEFLDWYRDVYRPYLRYMRYLG